MISVVIPSHNEEKVIEKVARNMSKLFEKDEIIVVSNGCTDRTPEIVDRLNLKNVKHINIKERIGKGGAVTEGFRCARGDILGFIDADDAFRNEDILKVVEETRKTDCVIASKWKGRKFSDVDWPFVRKLASRMANLFIRILFGLNFSDTQAGLKFFRRKVLGSIDMDFFCRGFEFDIELLYKIKKKGFEIREIWVPIKSKNTSTFSLFWMPAMGLNLLRLRFKLR
ncbi:MAG: glycosyltransferase family 2 protein [archaeon]|nr:MAG: glycosyltransferase family 2 protein [archaeon]